MSSTQTVDVDHYARRWGAWEARNRVGVLSDHLHYAERAGGRVVTGTLCEYVVAPDGRVFPVVCSEVVEICTEDGITDGRCGLTAVDIETGCCAGHGADRREWSAQIDAEAERRAEERWAL